MSADSRKISWLAAALLVVLRISIGWHLAYEGLWKLNTQRTANPWTAEGYLKNSTGPLRTKFREMTGDPNDLRWLDYDAMSAKWDAWRDRFVAHYKLTEDQQNRLAVLLDGPEQGFIVGLESLPSGFNFDDAVKSAGIPKGVIKYDANTKRLIVDSKQHLLPAEEARLTEVVKDAKKKAEGDRTAYDKLIDAIDSVSTRASKLSYRERLAAMLKGDPERVGIPLKGKEGEEEQLVVVGEVKFYKELIERYERNYANAKTKYQWDHLGQQWTELQSKRRTLVAPIQALEKDLFEDADKLLTEEQFKLGAVPAAVTEMTSINKRTMWGLTILGFLLMLGLFTRLSALGGAALLTMFYMAMPPWPGVQEIPSIEHNLIVNKVFVEMIALLALAAMPSGKWFGIDAIVSAMLHKRRTVVKR